MSACVALFEAIDPAVSHIEMFAGDECDTVYRKRWNEWAAE
jgi:hypothetical protein